MQNSIESWCQVSSTPPIWSIAYIQSKTNQNNKPTKHEIIISEYIAIRSMMSDITRSWGLWWLLSYWILSVGFLIIKWTPDLYRATFDRLIYNLPENDFFFGMMIVLCLYGAFGVCMFLDIVIRKIIHRIFLHPIEHACSAMLSFHKNQWTKQTYSDTTSAIEDITYEITTIYKLYETLYRQSQSRWLRSLSERLRTLLSESSLYMIQEISRLNSELHSQLTMQIDNLESARDQVTWLQRPSLTADIQTRLDRQIEQFRLLQQKLQNNMPTK